MSLRDGADALIEILGVYRVPMTTELIDRMLHAQLGDSIPPDGREAEMPRIEAELGDLVLVEAIVRAPCITKATHPTSRACEQAPWQVTMLSSDGEHAICDLGLDEPGTFPARIAFFLHYFDAAAPLRASSGDVAFPHATRMPPRLDRIIHYVPVD